ncbi:MAG: cell wall surface anchor family protein [Parcubacteria group bacterium Greene0714_7]|nr:MAG: cell wall surface anchor family protein [Parcubacteria group bacterium Greene0714_7]
MFRQTFGFLLIVLIFLSAPFSAFAATIYANSSTGNDSTGDGTSGLPYATFHKAYTSASANDTIDLTGTFTWTDAAETGDSATTGYTIGKNLTIQGQGSSATYIQAASASTTADRRVFTISSGVVVTMAEVNIRHGRITSTSYYGGGIANSGTLSITDSEINNNTAGGGGGGIDNVGTTTAQRISVYNNTTTYMGGGLLNDYYIGTGGYFVVENSTIYGNRQTSTSGYLNGGGVHVRGGSMSLTNNTITGNIAKGGGGLGMETTGSVYLMNNIIAGNTSQTYGSTYNDLKKDSGTIVDNGYNIIGQPGGYSLAATGDWSDTNVDGTYSLYTVGTTGSLNLDTGASINDNATSTPTWAVLASSIAINNGSTGSNGATSTVPTLDQRGASRSGTTDIGSFEYNGSGLTISAPSTQASAVSFSAVEYYKMTISWTNGSGSRRTVFMKAASSGTASPVDGTSYTASSVFGSGTQIGSSGWYAVYEGLNSSVTVTGLSEGVTYSVQVFEYNGITSGAATYQTASASNNPNTQASHTKTTLYINASTGNDSTGDGSSGSPYATFHKGYTTASEGDTLNLTGTFTWTDAAETGDSATTGYSIAKELIIQGQSATSTIFQSATASTTADRRVFTTSSGKTIAFNDVTIRHGRITSSSSKGGGIYSQGTTTVTRATITDNYVNGYGGGIAQEDTTNGGSLTLTSSTVANNTGVSQGGGVWNGTSSTGTVDIVNSTIAFNVQQASIATVGGGGVAYRSGSGTITNSTIVYNNIQNGGTANGAGVWFSPDTSHTIELKNNIIANNYKSGAALSGSYYDIYKGSSGTYTDNGANIIGKYTSSNLTVASSTLIDLQGTTGTGDGTFTRSSDGGSGSLYLDTALADNGVLKTQTIALTNASSIAIGNGYSGTNGSISVPSVDQRGGARVGTLDIGAYEYGATVDTTAPTVSLTAPSASATVSGESVSLTATASDGIGVAGVSFYVDGVLQGAEDTTSSYGITWDSTATSTGSHSAFAVARDTSSNYATSSSVSFTVDNTDPVISSVATTTTTTTATISWTTDEVASTKVNFGITSNYGTSTAEADTSPRATSHSVTITGLKACARYYYNEESTDAASNTATSTAATFRTTGCTGSASVSSTGEGTITTAAGGTLVEGRLTLSVPTSFTSTSSSATFQAHLLDGSTFFSSAGSPSGKSRAGSTVYNLIALTDATTTLSTFSSSLTVTLSYTADDVTGLDESTLQIYRYDSSSWSALSSCSVDTSGKTVTCTTTGFSDFAIFGDESSSSSSSSTTVGGGVIGGPLGLGYQKTSEEATPKKVKAITDNSDFFATTAKYRFTRTLRARSNGEDVQELQKFLNANGFTVATKGPGSPGNESDYFGPLTYNALVKFQEAHRDEILTPAGLKKGTGIFGAFTRGFVNLLVSH